jgi:uncharacterized protein (DUF433 family)
MSAVPTIVTVPLHTDPDGVIRVQGARVTLDSIVAAFRAGATAEEIAEQFPVLALADIYLIIAHYLRHTAEIDAYLLERQDESVALKREAEARFDPVGLRARLVARRNAARSRLADDSAPG